MSQQIPLKIYLSNQQQFRKFSIDETTSFADFLLQFKKIIGVKPIENEDVVYTFRIDYADEASDWIYLSGFEDTNFNEKDLEWKEAMNTGKKLGMLNLRVAINMQETAVGKQKRLEALKKKRQAEEEQRRQFLQAQQKKKEEYLKRIEEQKKQHQLNWKNKQQQSENEEYYLQSFYPTFNGFFGLLPMKRQNKAQLSNQSSKKEIPIETTEVPSKEEANEKESAETSEPVISPKPLEEKSVEQEEPKQDDDMPIIETIPEQSSSNQQSYQEPVEMETLKTMGFLNEKLNSHLLKQFNNDISKVVNSLLKLQSM